MKVKATKMKPRDKGIKTPGFIGSYNPEGKSMIDTS